LLGTHGTSSTSQAPASWVIGLGQLSANKIRVTTGSTGTVGQDIFAIGY